ncbi:MAG: hypothetical protein IPK85_19985 [Gemmatimonadetes bacterium]|nr:hypothetical protein [Gemmatimonadota bacterium]
MASLACDNLVGTDDHTLRIRGPADVSVPIGGTTQLFAIAVDERSRETVVKAEWEASDPNVVSVSQGGVLIAHSYGVAEIIARADGRIATVQVRTRPAGLALRLVGGGDVVEVGEVYRVLAEFLDVSGAAVPVPIELTWSASGVTTLAGSSSAGQHTATLRLMSPGQVAVRVDAPDGSFARLTLTALSEADPVVLAEENSLLKFRGTGDPFYAPDLVLRARLPVTITRLEFVGHAAACASVGLSRDRTTPLFDFQPYDWGWTAPSLRDGEGVDVDISMELPSGRKRVQRVRVTVASATSVNDRGVETFLWVDC